MNIHFPTSIRGNLRMSNIRFYLCCVRVQNVVHQYVNIYDFARYSENRIKSRKFWFDGNTAFFSSGLVFLLRVLLSCMTCEHFIYFQKTELY